VGSPQVGHSFRGADTNWKIVASIAASFRGSPRHARRDLEPVLSVAIEIVQSDFQTIPSADLLIASADVARAMGSDERRISWSDGGQWRSLTLTGRLLLDNDQCRRIVLYDATHNESMKFLETYQFAAAITTHLGERRLDGLAKVGRRIGAREVDSFSRGAVPSKSYTTLEHDDCTTSGQLLARYLRAYDPDLPREK
jgi:hypothetical protein